MTERLTHVRADGSAHMVDVTDKATTSRVAEAEGFVRTRADVLDLLLAGELPKGETLGVARIAGIQGAKMTPMLVPLCHPLPLSGVTVEIEPEVGGPHGDDGSARLRVSARVKTRGVTGVEMEALTAVSVACLTLFDMLKAVDKYAIIEGIRVLAKSGGKSGDWRR
ncbi:cyclic pyranopterin monophosphate synthase MoaC [Micrococcales bacterium 31B]|nr:cyclic pyranopterin monophosphate synthase MoaC [Micrococcales bacterium 31B]